jgi:hypothetical protein
MPGGRLDLPRPRTPGPPARVVQRAGVGMGGAPDSGRLRRPGDGPAVLTHQGKSQQSNELSGGFDALTGIPANQVDANVDLHPVRAPFCLTLSVNRVGRVTDSVSGLGATAGGRYTFVDLSGRNFLDVRRQHRINVRLENLFNEAYSTLHARGFPDASGAAYLVNTLGVPRTLHVSYSLAF